jgi:hypothetical protein
MSRQNSRAKDWIGFPDFVLGERFHVGWGMEESTGETLEGEGSAGARVNSYRVLLTRGRDGFFIFMPNEIGTRSTYSALVGVGVREMASSGVTPLISDIEKIHGI